MAVSIVEFVHGDAVGMEKPRHDETTRAARRSR